MTEYTIIRSRRKTMCLQVKEEMNHFARFWATVEKELPDYRKRRELLTNQ